MKSINPLRFIWLYFFFIAVLFQIYYKFQIPFNTLSYLIKIIFVFFILHSIYYLKKFWTVIDRQALLFFLTIFVLLRIKGVYLEYPSDSWEYFRLIFIWQNKVYLHEGSDFGRFILDPPRYAYFLYYSLLDYLPRSRWVQGVDFVSAATQTFVLYEIFNFSKIWFKQKEKQYFCVISSYLFTGYANLEYFLYLGLSANILSFSLFFEFQNYWLSEIKNFKLKENSSLKTLISIKRLTYSISMALLIYLTHNQGILFILTFITFLAIYLIFNLQSKKKYLSYILLFLFLNIIFLILHHDSYIKIITENASTYLDTLSLPYLLCLIIALFYIRKDPTLVLFASVPLFFVIFPASNFLLYKYILPYPEVGHRIFYQVPTGLILTFTLFVLLKKNNRKVLIAYLLLLLLSANPWRPWFGRLEHSIRQTSTTLTLQNYFPLIGWFEQNRAYKIKSCRWATDQTTDFMLMSYFGWDNINLRIQDQTKLFEEIIQDFYFKFQSLNDHSINNHHFQHLGFIENQNYCGILIRNPKQNNSLFYPIEIRSDINHKLHNWSYLYSQVDFSTSEKILNIFDLIKKSKEWIMTELPNDYFLFERVSR